jgi:polyhydroxybutyrate depolymerase
VAAVNGRLHAIAATALALLLAAGCASRPEPQSGEFPNESLTVGRAKREYRLYVPASANVGRPVPLVVAFHGMLVDSKDVMPTYTKLNGTAERHGFIIAYPNALGGVWGLWPDKIAADLAFFDALLARLSAAYRIDPERVYVLGMSNGGYFAHLLAKERSTVIAAVASHSGPLGLQTLGGVNATRKFPVLIAHGAQDLIFAVWIARENAEKYRREGHEVEYIELPRLGHAWATDANVNERIWRFFAAHPRAI